MNKLDLKAAALSAFVLPGLGQLAARRKVKGALLIGAVNVLLLTGLVLFAISASGLIQGSTADPGAALAGFRAKQRWIPWYVGALACVWIYGALDALVGGSGPPSEDDSIDTPSPKMQ